MGLEAATGREAVVTGKPSRTFFERALERAACTAAQTLVVGDDVGTDMRGARAVGAASALVATGKYLGGDEARAEDRPDHFLRSLGELARLLDAGVPTTC